MGEKALTKEDLIYILQAVLMLSQLPDNALHREGDGLYVKDYHDDLQEHTEDNSIHVTQSILDVLSHIKIDNKGELTYDGKQLMTYVSKEQHNALMMKPDGLYVKDTDASEHINDDTIHVTQDDKDNWDGMLDEANDYTDSEMETLPIRNFFFGTQLPNSGQSTTTLYFLANDPDRPNECTYTLYLWRDGAWHVLGMTKKSLQEYVTQKEFTDSIKGFIHVNQEVLDKFSMDENGQLLFEGKNIFECLLIHPDKTNALQMRDGQLYVRDYTQEINSMMTASSLAKVNLYDGEICESGKYQLKDVISNYSLLLFEYYYKPDKEGESPGCAKTAVIDTDTLVELRQLGRDYMLEYGYGIMTSNSKIYVEDDVLTVNYYHNVCIYKITGIRKGDEDGG